MANRTTTITHAFAAAIAPCDSYNETVVRDAMRFLGQDHDGELSCAYCGVPAETWDHIFATVIEKRFSGFGHRLGNLLPSCKPCNSKKGNKQWHSHLEGLRLPADVLAIRAAKIDSYLSRYLVKDPLPSHLPEYQQLLDLKQRILDLFAQADELASRLRRRSDAARPSV